MTTAVLDSRKRVVVSVMEPGQVVEIQVNPNGTVTLIPLKSEKQEKYPEGSLVDDVEFCNEEFAPMLGHIKPPKLPPDFD